MASKPNMQSDKNLRQGASQASRASVEQAIEHATALAQQGQFEAAADGALTILETAPDNIEALYLLAVCQRYRQQLDAALATLARLKQLQPAYGRAHQEEGHAQLAAQNPAAALAAYQQAVACNNSLLASWKALATLLHKAGESEQAAKAAFECTRLEALPDELLSVRNMTAEGRLFRAEQVCRSFLKQHPEHVEAMRLLADLGVKSGVLDDAEIILENAVKFEPHNNFARHDFMHVLYRRQKYQQSYEQAKILLELDPENLDFQISYANQCVAIGDYDPALDIYHRVIKQLPQRADLHLVHGHALKTIARVNDAIDAYRRAYRARNTFGDAYWSLANLKTYQFTAQEIELMKGAESDTFTLLEDRVHLCFALGKHYEDRQDFAQSAMLYSRGNSLRKSQLHYDAQQMEERLQLQEKHCKGALFAARAGSGCPAPDPIFIVGLPRAGSTLLEQILASHSKIDGTLELPNISSMAFRLNGRLQTDEAPKYPAVLSELSFEQLYEMGQAYLDDTRVHRQQAPYFIDKMPNNFRHIGLIHLILPNAKIIDARRHPMACCFSGYKQLFASGQEFTYGLNEIGRYYHNYVSLMDHWDKVLPDKILRVHYEDVVADVEVQTRRILDFCGLSFEQSCVDFYKTERSIRTPSSEQVRQPIYTSGLQQWRHFEPWLDPLKTALGSVLDRYPIINDQ